MLTRTRMKANFKLGEGRGGLKILISLDRNNKTPGLDIMLKLFILQLV